MLHGISIPELAGSAHPQPVQDRCFYLGILVVSLPLYLMPVLHNTQLVPLSPSIHKDPSPECKALSKGPMRSIHPYKQSQRTHGVGSLHSRPCVPAQSMPGLPLPSWSWSPKAGLEPGRLSLAPLVLLGLIHLSQKNPGSGATMRSQRNMRS